MKIVLWGMDILPQGFIVLYNWLQAIKKMEAIDFVEGMSADELKQKILLAISNEEGFNPKWPLGRIAIQGFFYYNGRKSS